MSFAWSHSALGTYEQCPYKYYRTKHCKKGHPDRIEDPMGEAALAGIRAHEDLEKRIKNKVPLPGYLQQHEDLCKMIEASTVDAILAAEDEFALNQQLQPCDWFSKPGALPTWLRGKIDVLIVKGIIAIIIDWKTGKVKEEMDQLKIFALMVFAHYPQVQTVKASYIWLKTREITPKTPATFHRDEVPELWREQFHRLTPLINSIETNQWVGRPGYLCKNYCVVSEKGACPYYQKP